MASNCMAVQDTSLERRNHELGENVMGAIGNPVAEGGNCGDTAKSGIQGGELPSYTSFNQAIFHQD